MNYGNKQRLSATAHPDNGTVTDRLEQHLLFKNGVKAECRLVDGRLHIRVDDFSSWVLAKSAAKNEFAFGAESIVRDV